MTERSVVSRVVRWHKSSRSFPGGDCVEVACDGMHVHVRDSKDPGGAVVTVDIRQWSHFLKTLTDGNS